jgi:hypothetical protein
MYERAPLDIISIAKAAARGDTSGLAGVMSAAEYLGEINKRAAAIRKPGESKAQAFARYTRDERHGGIYPDGPILLKAATGYAADVDPDLRKAYRPDPVMTTQASRDDLISEHIMPRLDKMRHDGESTDQVLARWAESDPEAALLMKAAGYAMPEAIAKVRKVRGFPEASLEPRVIATGADGMDRAAEVAQVMAIRPWMTGHAGRGVRRADAPGGAAGEPGRRALWPRRYVGTCVGRLFAGRILAGQTMKVPPGPSWLGGRAGSGPGSLTQRVVAALGRRPARRCRRAN